jgi:hypothetical protein
MGNIQKEISQLEHWLINLPEDVPSYSGISGAESHTLIQLCSVVEKLAEQLTVQQITLNNIIDRLDVLKDIQEEGIVREKLDEPWLDEASEPIKNEIIEGDLLEPVYIVTKKGETGTTDGDDTESIKPPSIHPGIPDDDTVIPDIASVIDEPVSTPAPIPVPVPVTIEKEEPVKVEDNVEVETEVEEEEEEEEEEVKEVEVEVQEEEEEEEGLELEEIEFKDVRYYKDEDGFIYTIDEDDQPSENPIGVWKEKTQSVAFYKTK